MSDNATADKTATEVKTNLLADLGFDSVVEPTAKLILWNDHVNDMIYVVISLMTICQLSPEEAEAIMLEAHTNGKAIAKTGELQVIMKMKEQLNDAQIEATIEH